MTPAITQALDYLQTVCTLHGCTSAQAINARIVADAAISQAFPALPVVDTMPRQGQAQ